MRTPTASDLSAQFEGIDAERAVASDTAHRIEGELDVTLPDEFGRICEFFDATPFAAGDRVQEGAQPYAHCVVSVTADCRRHLGLPSQYIVLAADDDVVLLLACAGAALGEGRVHLFPRTGLSLISSGIEPTTSRSWPSIVEYFADAMADDRRGVGT